MTRLFSLTVLQCLLMSAMAADLLNRLRVIRSTGTDVGENVSTDVGTGVDTTVDTSVGAYIRGDAGRNVGTGVGTDADTGEKEYSPDVMCVVYGSGCDPSEHSDPSKPKDLSEHPGPSEGHGPSEGDFTYGVVLDAGSSSTKLNVYRVTPSQSANSLPQLDIVHNQRFEPGVDTFVDNETGLREYLTPILEAARQHVPGDKQASTSIYLFATAGLRFFNAETTTKLIDAIRLVLQDSNLNPFLYKPAAVGVLSGEEEGVYAWVAANYLLGFFNGNRLDTEAVGVLEMGGGSTQITFIPRSPLYDGEFHVTIRNRTYQPYVHSYLQFGINAIVEWVAQVLSEKNPYQRSVANPCMLEGDQQEITLQNGKVLQLNGSSDPNYCDQILEAILRPETGIRCEPKPCAIGSVYQPDVDDIQFYATQAFTPTPTTLGVVGYDQILHLKALETAARCQCRRSLKESTDAGIDERFGSSTCLMGLYMPKLFTLSYGFPVDTDNIKVTSTINGKNVEWGLGLIVIELTGNNYSRRRR